MWEEVVSVKEPVALSLHRSKRSGLSVVVAKIPGPTSQLHVTFKSESFDDRGMPHSLEHLVFLGSESLPFKGVLDDCSQRVSASTNAWTAQESTTFTLDAGSECKVVEALLPLYLDSLFFPQLKEEHFLTEVHSINGENEDQGVVFCEMQGREQEQGDVTAYALNKLMFPGVNTINCNSGGSLAALRKPDNNMEAIRKYHSEAYRPENCIIFVSGCNFEFAELCAALDEIDARLAARSKSLPSVPKPFSSPLEPMVAKTETVYFPSDSDSFCTLELAWRVPGRICDNLELRTELKVLCEYLDYGISSPLYVALVDIAEPLASSVHFSLQEYAEIAITLTISGVPSSKAEQAEAKAMECLATIKQIDVDRMSSVLNSVLLDELDSFEDETASSIQDDLTIAFLYFDLKKDFESVVFGNPRRLQRLLDSKCSLETSGHWLNLLQTLFLQSPRVTLVVRPSTSLGEQLRREEEIYLEKRAKEIDLNERERALQNAKAILKGAPSEFVDSFCAPLEGKVDLSALHKFVTHTSGKLVQRVPSNPGWLDAHCHFLSRFPFGALKVNHYERTEFVSMLFSFNVSSLHDLEMLELWAETMFCLPIPGTGSHLEVEKAMRRDLYWEKAKIGTFGGETFKSGHYADAVAITCQAKVENYALAVEWIRKSLFEGVADASRLQVAISTLLSRADDESREVNTVEKDWKLRLMFDRNCVAAKCSLSQQIKFLRRFQKLLQKNPQKAEAKFERFVSSLRQAAGSCLIVQIKADMRRIALPHKPWTRWPFLAHSLPGRLSRPLSESLIKQKKSVSKVVKMAVDGGHATEWWQAPGVKTESDRKLIPVLSVVCDFISSQEGCLWKAVRGAGLAYGCGILHRPQDGLLELNAYRCASAEDAQRALVVARQKILALSDADFDESALKLGKSLSVNATLCGLETHTDAAEGEMRELYRGYSVRELLEGYSRVDLLEFRNAFRKFVMEPLKNGVTTKLFIVSNQTE